MAASPDPLRRVLAVYLEEEPAEIQLAEGEHGKPRLADPGARLSFNLSHSGEVALVALSGEDEVGVDIELVRPKREEVFYWRWACHEARVKCLGSGLLRARAAVPLEPLTVKPIDVGAGYAAAIAVAAAELPPLRGWTFGQPLHKDG